MPYDGDDNVQVGGLFSEFLFRAGMIVMLLGGFFALSGLLGVALVQMVSDPPSETIHQDTIIFWAGTGFVGIGAVLFKIRERVV